MERWKNESEFVSNPLFPIFHIPTFHNFKLQLHIEHVKAQNEEFWENWNTGTMEKRFRFLKPSGHYSDNPVFHSGGGKVAFIPRNVTRGSLE